MDWKTRPTFAHLGLLSLIISSAPAQIALKHYWSFEGPDPGADSAGGSNGTVTAATSITSGDGQAAPSTAAIFVEEITGPDDIIQLDGLNLFQPGTTAFSLSYWIKMPDDSTTAPRGIFDFSANGGDGLQSLYIGTTNELAVRIDFANNNNALVKIPLNLEDDQWHFIAATYDPASGLAVHIDGAGVDGRDSNTGEVSLAFDSYLGAFNVTGAVESKGLKGSLDDFAFYSGKLDDAQIAALFDGSTTPLDFLPAPPDTTLRITNLGHSSEGTTLTWPSLSGFAYSVWGSLDLETWSELEDAFEGTNNPLNYTHQPAEVPERYYYQIRIQER
jgi:hypothetical protein